MTRQVVAPRIADRALDALLEQAAASHSRVHLRATLPHSGVIAAGLVAARMGGTLVVEVDRVSTLDVAFHAGMPLQVSLEVGDDRYVFETRSITELSANATGQLRLKVPTSASREERRRSPRRRLKAQTEVVLHANRVQAAWRCRAVLLNLSADGLACRVSGENADELSVGRTVCVMFHPAETSGGFDLEARVNNLTEAGTADSWIVGLEFVHDTTPPGSRARLEEVLQA